MELWAGALNLGFLYAFVAIGIYITFRIHDFPDITVDGTFTTGAAVTSIMVVSGIHPLLALPASFFACAAAGSITAIINTRLNVNSLLAGILVMTGLYSINLHIMGRSNIPLLNTTEFFSLLGRVNPGLNREIWTAICLVIIMAAAWLIVSFFFKTDFGLSMRASGNNPVMARASGINVDRVKVFGVALANGLVGLSGSLVAQYQGFADIGMGIGTVVTGLASVIIGEAILKKHSVFAWIASAILGSIIFRFMIALALYAGMDPVDLKLVTAIFVLVTLFITMRVAKGKAWVKSSHFLKVMVTALIIIGVIAGLRYGKFSIIPQKKTRIGVFLMSDNPILTITRDSFLARMKELGYIDGRNATFFVENANGDMATVNTIADKFLREKVDIVVPISTNCTQVAINKIKNIPIVFATVANPFIIGTGKSDTDHLPNVTGVYGTMPMDKVMDVARKIFPGRIAVGAIWDPGQANSEYNIGLLKKAVKAYPDVAFVGGNISNSSEVYQVAQSLIQKRITAFVQPTDNIVFSAFDSVVKAAQSKKVPIIYTDVSNAESGALVVFGYTYETSGRQAADLVNRIIKGENPAGVPFERYKEMVLGINLKVAKELGITIPKDVLDRATLIIDEKGRRHNKNPTGADSATPNSNGKRIALFQFTDNLILDVAVQGVLDGLKKNGILDKEKISIDHKNSHGDYATAQSIGQEIVSKKYDYIITMSTVAAQVMINQNKKIPHIFAAVTDPVKSGIAKSLTDHPDNVTGIATPQPVESTVRLMRRVFPKAKVIGMIWNPAEANSEICTLQTREVAKKLGFKVVEVQITGTQEIDEALKSILGSKPDIFFTSGDTTVSSVIPSLAQKLRQKKIPYITNTPADIESGVFMCLGADYYDVGLKAAELTTRIIKGEKPAGMPVISYAPQQLTLSLKLAKEYGIAIPDDLIKKAAKVVK